MTSVPPAAVDRARTPWRSGGVVPAFDRLTGRVTMYRLVLICLLAVLVEALIASLAGAISYSAGAIVVDGVVLVLATGLSNLLFARVLRVKAHAESSLVTALILLFLFLPSLTVGGLVALIVAGVIASASKYVLAFRRRHVFNPAAVSAVVMSIAVPSAFPGWWVGAPALLPVAAVAAFVILARTRKLPMGVLFVVVGAATVTLASMSYGTPLSTAVSNALLSSPVVFFAGFMLSEPLTLPPRRWQQLALAVVVGVLFGLPFHVGAVYSTYELALVIGNLLAFLVGQRSGVSLALVAKRELTPGNWEFSFRSRRPLRHRAGQFVELSLPHARADVRGQRRTFSIASAPGDELIRFGMRVAEPVSTFKRALLALDDGATVSGTTLGGDFVLPRSGAEPLLLVAGGIGITPFVSQLHDLAHVDDARDVVLVYSVASADAIPYRDELVALGVRVALIAPAAPAVLPTGWVYAGAAPLRAAALDAALGNGAVRGRRAYVSGSPRFVASVRRELRAGGARSVTTDSFSGY